MNEKNTGADLKSATGDGDKKLYIETYGCQMNVADSEVIASVMKMAGYDTALSAEEADAIFLNTCSVRKRSARSGRSGLTSSWAWWAAWPSG